MDTEGDFWRRCNSCKKPIGFRTKYWICSVSTCTRKRTGLVFCSVACWDAHAPMMNHRDAGAVEHTSPSREAWAAEQAAESSSDRENPSKAPSQNNSQITRGENMENENTGGAGDGKEVLVVASKLKNYIKAKSGMNTSGAVMEILSERL